MADLRTQLTAAQEAVSSSQNVKPAGGGPSGGAAEVDGLRLSVKELSDQVQRYAQAAERLTEELDSAHDAAAKTEEEVCCKALTPWLRYQ